MNVFAHVAVAGRAAGPGADERFLLGAALSDLASFGGFRLLGRSPDPLIRQGMAFHHHSDDAFHRHTWFRSRNRSAASALEQRALPRGGARACAHVGVELLLDGALHGHGDDRRRFSAAMSAAPSLGAALAPLVESSRQQTWLDHLDRVASAPGLPPYTEPSAVAQRLHRICGRRPRLSFEPEGVEAVAEVLGGLLASIHETGPALVDELAALLRPQSQPPAG